MLVTQKKATMHMLYDSESFAVVQMTPPPAEAGASTQPQLQRQGFEIVDKRSGREVYLDGSWAEMFQARLNLWRDKAPTEEEVETTLEGYAALAHTPLLLH